MEVFAFIASVDSFGELLLKSFGALYRLQTQLSEAPDEITRLFQAMQRFKSVLDEIQSLGAPEVEALGRVPSLSASWQDHAAATKADLTGLLQTLERLQDEFSKPSRTSKMVRARFRKVLSNHEVERFERILSAHQSSFMFMLSVIQERRNRDFTYELRTQGRRLAALTNTGTVFILPGRHEDRDLERGVRNVVVRELRRLSSSTLGSEELHAIATIQSAVKHPGSLVMGTSKSATDNSSVVGPGTVSQTDALFSKTNLVARELICQVFSTYIPIGVVSGRLVKSSVFSQGSGPNIRKCWCLDVSLYPFAFWAKSVFRLYLKKASSGVFTFAPRRYEYNHSPELRKYLNAGDASAIRRMFTEGKAHPTDVFAPSGNSLLHEIVVRHGMGIPNMLDLCETVLQSTNTIDYDLSNRSGRTPLMQCCQFMLESEEAYNRMRPMTSLLVERGADMAISDRNGQSSCLLIFQMPQGLQYLTDYLYKFINLEMLQNLQPRDLWLVSSLARSTSVFGSKLRSEYRDLRTPADISSDNRSRLEILPELDPEKQAEWVRNAGNFERATFMRTLCSYGTVEMVQQFIGRGIDLEETEPLDGRTYIRHAARKGNLEVVVALADAGASLEQEEWFQRKYNLCASVLEELLERWGFITQRKPIWGKQLASPDSELWILPWLLRQPNHHSHNALYIAMGCIDALPIVKAVLEFGCGRRDGQPARTDHGRRCGSEVIDAVRNGNPYLKHLLDAGLALECEDWLGISAVIYAVDFGSLDSLELLIQEGVDVERRCGYGLTPIELATANMKLAHPRVTTRGLAYTFPFPKIYVDIDTDRKLYECLKRALKCRRLSSVAHVEQDSREEMAKENGWSLSTFLQWS
ncbi:ankyrin unc44 [Colletotrichum truncatum]|uniref:Ankyrin unc44 n=1 Tax=Colletotrichum truncatum TaxID=5467 RepID=A0ACC3Z4Z2_COLTU